MELDDDPTKTCDACGWVGSQSQMVQAGGNLCVACAGDRLDEVPDIIDQRATARARVEALAGALAAVTSILECLAPAGDEHIADAIAHARALLDETQPTRDLQLEEFESRDLGDDIRASGVKPVRMERKR